MELDESIGMSGENVKPLPNDITNALPTAYQRYSDYREAFGPEEVYLKKKLELEELGTKMIHLKMRCSSLGSEWGKVLMCSFGYSFLIFWHCIDITIHIHVKLKLACG
ncbi:hypothetical protein AALP_AA6G163600 [Arabis alpina]|uniref:Uncharacterized protein n=1 Tax=Arabis alpina TaxID=50452 RepID=A0A087GPM5_ARAAL|nr:hypothetical protein AALP_AA6G163600 [Arabis alpina]